MVDMREYPNLTRAWLDPVKRMLVDIAKRRPGQHPIDVGYEAVVVAHVTNCQEKLYASPVELESPLTEQIQSKTRELRKESLQLRDEARQARIEAEEAYRRGAMDVMKRVVEALDPTSRVLLGTRMAVLAPQKEGTRDTSEEAGESEMTEAALEGDDEEEVEIASPSAGTASNGTAGRTQARQYESCLNDTLALLIGTSSEELHAAYNKLQPLYRSIAYQRLTGATSATHPPPRNAAPMYGHPTSLPPIPLLQPISLSPSDLPTSSSKQGSASAPPQSDQAIIDRIALLSCINLTHVTQREVGALCQRGEDPDWIVPLFPLKPVVLDLAAHSYPNNENSRVGDVMLDPGDPNEPAVFLKDMVSALGPASEGKTRHCQKILAILAHRAVPPPLVRNHQASTLRKSVAYADSLATAEIDSGTKRGRPRMRLSLGQTSTSVASADYTPAIQHDTIAHSPFGPYRTIVPRLLSRILVDSFSNREAWEQAIEVSFQAHEAHAQALRVNNDESGGGIQAEAFALPTESLQYELWGALQAPSIGRDGTERWALVSICWRWRQMVVHGRDVEAEGRIIQHMVELLTGVTLECTYQDLREDMYHPLAALALLNNVLFWPSALTFGLSLQQIYQAYPFLIPLASARDRTHDDDSDDEYGMPLRSIQRELISMCLDEIEATKAIWTTVANGDLQELMVQLVSGISGTELTV